MSFTFFCDFAVPMKYINNTSTFWYNGSFNSYYRLTNEGLPEEYVCVTYPNDSWCSALSNHRK